MTESGVSAFDKLGIDADALAKKRRPMVLNCFDWTERRHYLAESLAANLLEIRLQRLWAKEGSLPRALTLTSSGREALFTYFGLNFSEQTICRDNSTMDKRNWARSA